MLFGFNQVFCEVDVKRMCLAQANADLAEAAEKLEIIRKKLAVSLSFSISISSVFYRDVLYNLKCVSVKCGGVGW